MIARRPVLTPPTNVCCAAAVAPRMTVSMGDVVSIVTVSVTFGTADVFQLKWLNQSFDTVPTQTGEAALAGPTSDSDTPVSAVEPISKAIREPARDARPRTTARPKPASRLKERFGPFGMHDLVTKPIDSGADTGHVLSRHGTGLNRAETARGINEVCGVCCLGTERQSLHLQRLAGSTATA